MAGPCRDCFLYERTGGVCPAARDSYEEDRSAALMEAILTDPARTPAMLDLIQADAERLREEQVVPHEQKALGPALQDLNINPSHKEATDGVPSRADR
jgi:hypothetical protein